MENNWKNIWNKRKNLVDLSNFNEFESFVELKKLDGFDVSINDSKGYYNEFYESILNVYNNYLKDSKSIFEVGCGSGANLLIFSNRGKKLGAIDYSSPLLSIASKIVPEANLELNEAINLSDEEKYDIVISDSVFAYFKDVNYGLEVLEKMYNKANDKIVLLEIYDKSKEEECMNLRRATIKNYDEIYKGLDKTFYFKDDLIDFANKHNCDIIFFDVKNEYYWNSKYMFNCVFIKK